MTSFKTKAFFLGAGVAMVASPLATSAAAAQSRDPQYDQRDDGYDQQDRQYDPRDQQNDPRDQQYDPRDGGYDQDDRGPPPGYDDRGRTSGQDDQYYDEAYDRGPPPGYTGTQPPPPPRGYRADGDQNAYLAEDDRFAGNAENWARDNCFKSRNNAGVGAVVGGVIGALVGNGLSGRRDRTGGTIAGAAVGAAGGAVVGSASSNATSPGCPPGYVVRGGAANFSYAPGYAYAAPGWYRPWVFVGGRWNYRPYPYHRFYARYYRRPYGFRRPLRRRGPRYRRF